MFFKLTVKNFFARFKTYFICLGIFIFGLSLAVLVFIGGMQLVFSLQPNNLIETAMAYFNNIQINNIYEILNLSILQRLYNDIVVLSGSSSDNVVLGLFIVIAICVFIVYGSFKGSIAVVGTLNKKLVSDKKTKSGAKPLLIKLLIGLVFAVLLTFVMKMWAWSGIFVLLIYVSVDALELIFSLHYVYFSHISISEMFKEKTVIKIMFLYIGWQAFFIIIASLLGFISPIISFIFAIPLLAYNECNITYSVITYYKKKI